VRGFAAFAAMRYRREERAVGFHHEGITRNTAAASWTVRAFLKVTMPVNETRCPRAITSRALGERVPEAVKDGAQLPVIRAEEVERFVPGVALVNDDVEAKLGGEVKLLLKQHGLGALAGVSRSSSAAWPVCSVETNPAVASRVCWVLRLGR